MPAVSVNKIVSFLQSIDMCFQGASSEQKDIMDDMEEAHAG